MMNRDDHKAVLMSSYKQLTHELKTLEHLSKKFLHDLKLEEENGEKPSASEVLHWLVTYQAQTASVIVALSTMAIAHLNLDNQLHEDITIQ